MKAFYDIHCHIMGLNHPGFIPLIKRLRLENYLFLNALPVAGALVSALASEKMASVMNLLSIMDRTPGEILLTIEERDIVPFLKEGKLRIGSALYDRIVLTPLMIDFGAQGADYPGIWYSRPGRKAVSGQAHDLFTGIQDYQAQSHRHLFTILPFLGINTKNYELKSTTGRIGLTALLERHFSSYSPSIQKARVTQGHDRPAAAHRASSPSEEYACAGIKLYPPLGFDPWPDNNRDEREKAEYLYQFCEKRHIPITTHCGGEGYRIVSKRDYRRFTSPERWRPVLKQYPELKVNFAHFGGKLNTVIIHKKMKGIAALMREYEHVYTDIACLCSTPTDYERLSYLITRLFHSGEEEAFKKILFGSDFMINLLWVESLQECYGLFAADRSLDTDMPRFRELIASENPASFLFGDE